MTISLKAFSGEIPAVHKRLLPGNAAQIAMNLTLSDGTLHPIEQPAAVATATATPPATIFKDGPNWLSWNTIVDVVRGPVAQDRLYITGDGAPKVRIAGATYPLALPAPETAPSVTNLSTPDPATSVSVVWAYTFVTQFGEESPPSPVSLESSASPSTTQQIGAFASAPAGRGVTHMRLYRSITSTSGATELFFAAEVPIATLTHDFTLSSTPLGEQIPSTDYDPPPEDMIGIVSMPNGMMAAFSGKEVHFCEPYIPHAWPRKYSLAVDTEIVGLAAFGSNLAILTRGSPYLAQGLHPSTIGMEKLESGAPCLSRRGIVDLGYAAAYPSVEGLMLLSGSETRNITANLFSRKQWAFMSPETMVAQRYEDQYLFSRTISRYTIYDCDGPGGWGGTEDVIIDTGSPDTDEPGFVTLITGGPGTGLGDARIGSILIGQGGGLPSFTDADVLNPSAMHSDPQSSRAYFADTDGTILEWRPDVAPLETMLWRSKAFSANTPVSYGAVYVRTARPLVGGDSLKVRIFGNGTLLREVTQANKVQRLPGNRLYEEWEVEVEANVPVVAVVVAETPEQAVQGAI